MNISDDEVEKALRYLATSAADYSKARGLVVWLEGSQRIIEAEAFSRMTGTMDERKSQSRITPEYKENLDKYRDAVCACEHIRALRDAAETRIRVWQTWQATLRSVNVS